MVILEGGGVHFDQTAKAGWPEDLSRTKPASLWGHPNTDPIDFDARHNKRCRSSEEDCLIAV